MRSTATRVDRRPRLSAAAVVVSALLPAAGALPAAASETTGASLAISALDGSCGLRVSAVGAAPDEAHTLSVSAVTAGTTSPSGRELLGSRGDWQGAAGEDVRASYSLDLGDYRTSGDDAATVTVTAVLDRVLTRSVTLRLPDCKVQPPVTPSPQPVRPTPTATPRPGVTPTVPRPTVPPARPAAPAAAPAAKPAKPAAAPRPTAAPKRPAAVVAHGGAGLAVLPAGAGPAHPGSGFAAAPPVALPQQAAGDAAPAPIVAAPAPRTLLEALGVPAVPAAPVAASEAAPEVVATRLVADRQPASGGGPLAALLVASAAATLGLRRRRHS